MFNWLKKTAKKVDENIEKAADNVDDVLKDTRRLLEDGRRQLQILSMLALFGIVLGITADIVSIAVGTTLITVNRKIN